MINRMLPKQMEKLTVNELRRMCDERGLPSEGLLKGQLIEALVEHETEHKSFAVSTPKESGKSNKSMQSVIDAELKKLEMQLELEKIKLEREREKDRLEREREREKLEAQLRVEKDRLEREREREKHELEREREREKHELVMTEKREQARALERNHELSMQHSSELNSSFLGKYGPKAPKFKEGEDVEAYLRTFERLAAANKWPADTWAPRLAAVLTGKAREAYALMPVGDIESYDKVKITVLKKYNLGSEAYREKFRTTAKRSDERFQEWGTKVSQYFDRWLEINNVSDFEQLREFMIVEQLINMLSSDLQIWIKERKPGSVEKMTELAELYVTSRRKSHIDHSSGKSKVTGSKTPKGAKAKDNITCYNCQKKGHYASECHNETASKDAGKQEKSVSAKAAKPKALLCLSPSRPGFLSSKKFIVPGKVDSIPVEMLLDTGCTNTLVKSDLVAKKSYDGSSFTIILANGMKQKVPTADVMLSGSLCSKICNVGVLDNLPVDVLLSERDFSVISSFDSNDQQVSLVSGSGDILSAAALTRAQKKILEEREREAAAMSEIEGIRPLPVRELPDTVGYEGESSDSLVAESEDEDISQQSVGAVQDTVDNKGESNFLSPVSAYEDESHQSEIDQILSPDFVCDDSAGAESNVEQGVLPHIDMWKLTAKELALRQKQDTKIAKLLPKVKTSLPSDKVGYYYKDGLLYRRYLIESSNQLVDQLVVPSIYKLELLELAHSIPLAGHLGSAKTRDRLLEHYYWPGIYKDVDNFCATCKECQLGARKRSSEKAPLISVPVVGKPFFKVATDIVGPLPRTDRGHKYLLTLVDYATRYPDAIPLKDITASAVADGLVEMFARYGVPAELISDQGSNFMSQLVNELLLKLGVKKLETSCYHPQANGLVERFHATLKSMLKKFVSDEPKNWDKFLPYLLFAYREVPEVSTGFSPFELLYGRSVRGPLAILKESWTGELHEGENVVEYVLNAREKMSKMADVVQENLTKSQTRQKTYYDKTARGKKYEAGEEVLVMLPSASSKLTSTWQGPFPVVRQVSPVDYEVDTGRHRKRLRTFHVNLLRKWNDRAKLAFYAQAYVLSEDDILNYLPKQTPSQTAEDVNISSDLTPFEQSQIKELVNKYSSIFSDVPTATNAAIHDVKTGDAKPVRTRPYRLPECHREAVRQHIHELEEAKVIERAPPCAWGSGLVIVPKKDGSIRMCVDYRALNKVTETDSGGNLPHIDELIEKVSRAKYISTLDLCKGYYAIPLSEAAKLTSTFVSPFGSFRFRVMPFGMKNAPMSFTRMMNSVLDGTEDYVVVYIDDIAVFSDTFAEHLIHLEDVFRRLEAANLKVKPSKVFLGHAVLDFLGHVVGSGKVEPMKAKIESISVFPQPETKKDVRRFLGLAGYYRRFIPSFSEVAAALTDLTKKDMPNKVKWTENCQKSFQALKNALERQPVLVSPDYSKPFLLQVDASERGLGAVLAQEDANGHEHPIVYCSRKLLERERHLSTTEKECLGIIWSLKLLRPYLLGHEVILETDHNPLVWLEKVKGTSQKLLRWSLALQEYNLVIRYKRGLTNVGPDCLSRV